MKQYNDWEDIENDDVIHAIIGWLAGMLTVAVIYAWIIGAL